MMRVVALAAAVLALLGQAPLRLKPGDTVAITSPYGGDFKIMPDGAIYGRGFGRLTLAGKTWDEAQTAVRQALRPYVRPSEVDLVVKDLRRDVVYLVGMNGGHGPIDLAPNLTLRGLLASATLDANADQVEVQLFREGKVLKHCNVATLLSGGEPDLALSADDVVNLAPVPFVRVWVTGFVARSGQIRLQEGSDVYQAIAEAGGFRWPDMSADASIEREGRVVIRRGPDSIELPLREDQKAKPTVVEAGDTISVLAPEERRITVAGEIAKPGEVVMRGEHSLTGAIAMAGGCGPEGTLATVLVMRQGELYQVDASAPTQPPFSLESGDLVYIQRNQRAFLVLGETTRPGRILMKDDKKYRLTDALAEAGGLSSRGSLRRIYVSHPGPDGKMIVKQFNLDEFLKDGKAAANPDISAGDCILVGQPKGVTLSNVAQFMSGAVLLESLIGGIRR